MFNLYNAVLIQGIKGKAIKDIFDNCILITSFLIGTILYCNKMSCYRRVDLGV